MARRRCTSSEYKLRHCQITSPTNRLRKTATRSGHPQIRGAVGVATCPRDTEITVLPAARRDKASGIVKLALKILVMSNTPFAGDALIDEFLLDHEFSAVYEILVTVSSTVLNRDPIGRRWQMSIPDSVGVLPGFRLISGRGRRKILRASRALFGVRCREK